MPVSPPNSDDVSVICLSTADWDAELWTNKQHLMSRLAARGTRVLYIDSLGLRAPSASTRDLSRVARRVRAWRPWAVPTQEESRVLRDAPLVLPLHGVRAVRALNGFLLRSRLARNCRRWRLEQSVLWTYTPAAVDIYEPRKHRALVYHCVDDLAAYPGVDAESFRASERKLVRLADVCIASSRPLVEMLERQGARDVRYWPNPADVEHFASAGLRERTPTRVIGFVGAIQEHKIDMELLYECARARPDLEFRLVGPVGLGLGRSTIGASPAPENVHFTGAVRHADLPSVVAGFDVALIPYAENGYTRHVFPMKVFEYLAAGVPVVSTPLPSLVGEVEHVAFASGAQEFVAEIDRALDSAAEHPALREERMAYARRFSWETRADEALAVLRTL